MKGIHSSQGIVIIILDQVLDRCAKTYGGVTGK